MESKDLRVVLLAGCLSLVASSYILGKSISTGLQYHGSYISGAESQVAGAVGSVAGNMQALLADPHDDVMDVSQAALYLRISESELYSLLQNSKAIDGKGIPHYKIGKNVYLSKTALANWVVTSAENRYEY